MQRQKQREHCPEFIRSFFNSGQLPYPKWRCVYRHVNILCGWAKRWAKRCVTTGCILIPCQKQILTTFNFPPTNASYVVIIGEILLALFGGDDFDELSSVFFVYVFVFLRSQILFETLNRLFVTHFLHLQPIIKVRSNDWLTGTVYISVQDASSFLYISHQLCALIQLQIQWYYNERGSKIASTPTHSLDG